MATARVKVNLFSSSSDDDEYKVPGLPVRDFRNGSVSTVDKNNGIKNTFGSESDSDGEKGLISIIFQTRSITTQVWHLSNKIVLRPRYKKVFFSSDEEEISNLFC